MAHYLENQTEKFAEIKPIIFDGIVCNHPQAQEGRINSLGEARKFGFNFDGKMEKECFSCLRCKCNMMEIMAKEKRAPFTVVDLFDPVKELCSSCAINGMCQNLVLAANGYPAN